MSKKSKVQSLLVAQGIEIMLDSIPVQALPDPDKARQALQKFRLRQDNCEVSAFAELMSELTNYIHLEMLNKTEIAAMFVQLKVNYEQ